jgi:hypothetical protein
MTECWWCGEPVPDTIQRTLGRLVHPHCAVAWEKARKADEFIQRRVCLR